MTIRDRELDRDLDRLAERLGPRAERAVPIGPMTTYRVGGPAALLTRVESIDDLADLARALENVAVPVLVVGRGSNLLVADEGFAGLAICLGEFANEIVIGAPSAGRETIDVVAGAAVFLPILARRTAAAALTGLEWAVGVPGSVGGAVSMNAGGHGSDMAASLITVEVFDLDEQTRAEVPVDALGLRFRGSDLAAHQVVVGATFALRPGDRDRSEAEITEIVRWRREHQPGGHNAGSVFVNPIPEVLPAAKVIDELGLRGFRIGSAEVSTKHANFIQADDNGRAADVRAVIDEVRERVLAHHGIALHSEVRLVGFTEGSEARSGVVVRRVGRGVGS